MIDWMLKILIQVLETQNQIISEQQKLLDSHQKLISSLVQAAEHQEVRVKALEQIIYSDNKKKTRTISDIIN